MTYHFHLTELIDIERLQTLQNHFRKAMGIDIVIVDEKGIAVIKPDNSGLFDHHTYHGNIYKHHCYENKKSDTRTIQSLKKLEATRCDCGFIEVAAPLIVRGQYLGVFLLGHGKIEMEKEHNTPEMSCMQNTQKKNV